MQLHLSSTPRAQLGLALQTHEQDPAGSATKGEEHLRDGQVHLQPEPAVAPSRQGGQDPSSTTILMSLKMQGWMVSRAWLTWVEPEKEAA